jgi:hypothetical protein
MAPACLPQMLESVTYVIGMSCNLLPKSTVFLLNVLPLFKFERKGLPVESPRDGALYAGLATA